MYLKFFQSHVAEPTNPQLQHDSHILLPRLRAEVLLGPRYAFLIQQVRVA